MKITASTTQTIKLTEDDHSVYIELRNGETLEIEAENSRVWLYRSDGGSALQLI
jgi:hypothetical protein